MLSKISHFLFPTLLLTAGMIYINSHLPGLGILDLQWSVSLNKAVQVLTQWGEEGRDLFIQTLWIDFVYPFFYSLLIYSLLTKKNMQGLLVKCDYVLPLATCLSDWLENYFERMLVLNFSAPSNTVFRTAQVFTVAKYLSILISILFYFIKKTNKNHIFK